MGPPIGRSGPGLDPVATIRQPSLSNRALATKLLMTRPRAPPPPSPGLARLDPRLLEPLEDRGRGGAQLPDLEEAALREVGPEGHLRQRPHLDLDREPLGARSRRQEPDAGEPLERLLEPDPPDAGISGDDLQRDRVPQDPPSSRATGPSANRPPSQVAGMQPGAMIRGTRSWTPGGPGSRVRDSSGARRWTMVRTFSRCAGLLAPLLLARTTGAAVWTVSPPGGGGQFTTIQGAINAAAPGDTVLVLAGSYGP